MSDVDNENLDQAVDPPSNDGGTKVATTSDSSTVDAAAVDPPNNDGGTGK
jgi:hypothetical protein